MFKGMQIVLDNPKLLLTPVTFIAIARLYGVIFDSSIQFLHKPKEHFVLRTIFMRRADEIFDFIVGPPQYLVSRRHSANFALDIRLALGLEFLR
jgi:hypothetical protein